MSIIAFIIIGIAMLLGGTISYKMVRKNPRETAAWCVGVSIVGSLVSGLVGLTLAMCLGVV